MQEKPPTPTVLIVDDEPLIRWSLSQGLTDAGYPVKTAGTAAETRLLLNAAAGTSMVVLLDLRLPDVSNLSLLRELRTKWPGVAVVMMSAHGSADDARRAVEMGAFRFVTKPFDVAEMVSVVADAWSRRQV